MNDKVIRSFIEFVHLPILKHRTININYAPVNLIKQF
jgi:hypothetical protein